MSFEDLEIQSNNKYVKVKPGVPQEMRILSEEPFVQVIHGFGKEKKECGGEHCLKCAGGDQKKQRFFVNVYNHTFKKVLIWEFGSMIAKQLKKISVTLKEEGRPLMDVDLKVEAEGSNMNTIYTVTPRGVSQPVPTGLVLHKLDLPF